MRGEEQEEEEEEEETDRGRRTQSEKQEPHAEMWGTNSAYKHVQTGCADEKRHAGRECGVGA